MRAWHPLALLVGLTMLVAGCRDPQCRPGTIFVRAECPKDAKLMDVAFTVTRPGFAPAKANVTTRCPTPATLEVRVTNYESAEGIVVTADATVDGRPYDGIRPQLQRLMDECEEWAVGLDAERRPIDDAQAPDASVCDEAGCPKRGNGERCTQGDECQSSHCVDGVCCNDACTGSCRTCAGETPGQCTLVASGRVDPRATCEAQSPGTCGTTGACDGKGGCAYHGPETVCSGSFCDGNVFTATRACDGAGKCAAPFSIACAGGFACGAVACKTACSSNEDCAANHYCAGGGACALKKPFGDACTLHAECANGRCVDGFCCNAACDLPCDVCNAAENLGTCTLVEGYDLCNGSCANRKNDPANCGKCGNACAAGQTCNAGTCRGEFEAPLVVVKGGLTFSGTVVEGDRVTNGFGVGEDLLDAGARRTFLTFDISPLPQGATLSRATLTLNVSICVNDPFTNGHGDVIVEPALFGTLVKDDFSVPATGLVTAPVTIVDNGLAGVRSADVSAFAQDAVAVRAQASDRVQLRVRFRLQDVVVDGVRRLCGFTSGGNAANPAPTLRVEYEVP